LAKALLDIRHRPAFSGILHLAFALPAGWQPLARWHAAKRGFSLVVRISRAFC
jgi:hypothetical protein